MAKQEAKRAKFGRDSYRKAIETGNFELLADALARDGSLATPLRPEPIQGRQMMLAFLGQLVPIFQDFRFTDEIDSKDKKTKGLVFKATVPAKDGLPAVEIQVTDLLKFNQNDRVREMAAMARPIQALKLLTAHGVKIPPGA